MDTTQRIIELIYEAVDELNAELEADRRVEKDASAVLFGRGGRLDSIGLVNLIVLVEEKVGTEFGNPITLADERAMSQKSSPFRTITSLAEYAASLVVEAS